MITAFEDFENSEESMVCFELGQLDNRVVKLKKQDAFSSYMIDYTFVFASVFERHYFSELFHYKCKEKKLKIDTALTLKR